MNLLGALQLLIGGHNNPNHIQAPSTHQTGQYLQAQPSNNLTAGGNAGGYVQATQPAMSGARVMTGNGQIGLTAPDITYSPNPTNQYSSSNLPLVQRLANLANPHINVPSNRGINVNGQGLTLQSMPGLSMQSYPNTGSGLSLPSSFNQYGLPGLSPLKGATPYKINPQQFQPIQPLQQIQR